LYRILTLVRFFYVTSPIPIAIGTAKKRSSDLSKGEVKLETLSYEQAGPTGKVKKSLDLLIPSLCYLMKGYALPLPTCNYFRLYTLWVSNIDSGQ
jgi:hypothetical protein